MRGIGDGNEGNQSENFRIGKELMNYNWRRIEIKENVCIYKNIILALWYEKQLKKLIY